MVQISQDFFLRSSGLLRNVITVGGFTLISRVTGFLRDVLMANILGTSFAADAFLVALKFPNFFRRLFAEGALSASFIPLFTRIMTAYGRSTVFLFAAETMGGMVTVLVPFTLMMIVGMPFVIGILAPGFNQQELSLAVELAQITFPYLFSISLVALLGAIFNALHRFAFFAATPIVFNIILIIILIFAWMMPSITPPPAYALAYGVGIAGVVQLLMMWRGTRHIRGTIFVTRPRITRHSRRLLRLMIPGGVTGVVMQINGFVDIFLASLLSTGAISYLYYAERLYQLPVAVIGVALGTSLLPILSRHFKEHEKGQLHVSLNRSLEWGLMLGVPAAVGLIILSELTIRVLYERGAFDDSATQASAAALRAYALGIPAYIGVRILNTVYFARQNMVTPLKIVLFTAIFNAVLAYRLLEPLGHVGIALATGITFWLNFAILIVTLYRRRDLHIDTRLGWSILKIGISTLSMGIGLYSLIWIGAHWIAEKSETLALIGFILFGMLTYILIIRLFNILSFSK